MYLCSRENVGQSATENEVTANIAHCTEQWDSREQVTKDVVGNAKAQLCVAQQEVGTINEEEAGEGADEDAANDQQVRQVHLWARGSRQHS